MHHDLDIVQRTLRDQVSSDFKTIWLDNEELYASTLQFVQRFQPQMINRVKLWTRPVPIFDAFGIKVSDRETPDILDVFNTSPQEVERRSWHDPARWAPDYNAMADDEIGQHHGLSFAT